MLAPLHRHLQRHDRSRVLLVKPDGEHVASGLDRLPDGLAVSIYLVPPARGNDQQTVCPDRPSLIALPRQLDRPKMALTVFSPDVYRLPARCRLPSCQVLDDVARQDLRRRIAFRSARHVHLAEQHHAVPFAELHQRAVLQAVAPINDRQEVSPRGLLDQDGRHVAAAAGSPRARHLDAAPLDRWGTLLTDFVG